MSAAKKSTAVISMKEEMEREAAELAKRISAPQSKFLRTTQDKQFVMPDGSKSPGPLSVVIVDFISANFYFDRPYKADEILPPACFAMGLEPDELVPHETAPVPQAKSCKECPNNEFHSKGAGKACGNHRILALLPNDADSDSQILLLKTSPTAIRPFDNYINLVKSKFNVPPVGVITDIFFDPAVTYASLRFGNPQPNPNLAVHFERKAEARKMLLNAPDVSKYEPPKKGKR